MSAWKQDEIRTTAASDELTFLAPGLPLVSKLDKSNEPLDHVRRLCPLFVQTPGKRI